MNRRRRYILGTAVVLGAVVAWSVALALTTGRRVDCRAYLASAATYAGLAVVDEEGYVLPFSKVNVDDDAAWDLEIVGENGGVRRVRDRSLIRRLQGQRFACTGGDMATPDMGFGVYRNGALVYRTDVVKGEGIQNRELGFARAKNRLELIRLLR